MQTIYQKEKIWNSWDFHYLCIIKIDFIMVDFIMINKLLWALYILWGGKNEKWNKFIFKCHIFISHCNWTKAGNNAFMVLINKAYAHVPNLWCLVSVHLGVRCPPWPCQQNLSFSCCGKTGEKNSWSQRGQTILLNIYITHFKCIKKDCLLCSPHTHCVYEWTLFL